MKDQIVLITGASGGIGSVTAGQFADAGAKVVLHYNSQKEITDNLCKKLNGTGHITVSGDLANPNDINKIAEQAFSTFGRIDVLVNNAGAYAEHPLENVSFDDWQAAWTKSIRLSTLFR